VDIAHRVVAPVLALSLALSLVLAAAPGQATATPGPRLAALVTDVPQAKLGASYQRGCPVPPDRLRLIRMNHWGFDGRVHRGELIVHQGAVRALLHVFGQAFEAQFPIRRMRVMAEYGGSDAAAMADDNTSAFNCRRVTGDPGTQSRHSYGDAVDINPRENPYVDSSGDVHPSAGDRHLDRDRPAKGMIAPGDVIVSGMDKAGWQWGGRWQPPDYQHFSADGS
jgi:hypothetical protein